MAGSKWAAYMKQAKELEKTSGKEFKVLVRAMSTFDADVKKFTKEFTKLLKKSENSAEDIEKSKDTILGGLKNETVSSGAQHLVEACDKYINQGKMSKLRMAFRSKSKNKEHGERMQLAENVKKYARSEKYAKPEAYYEKKLKAAKELDSLINLAEKM